MWILITLQGVKGCVSVSMASVGFQSSITSAVKICFVLGLGGTKPAATSNLCIIKDLVSSQVGNVTLAAAWVILPPAAGHPAATSPASHQRGEQQRCGGWTFPGCFVCWGWWHRERGPGPLGGAAWPGDPWMTSAEHQGACTCPRITGDKGELAEPHVCPRPLGPGCRGHSTPGEEI